MSLLQSAITDAVDSVDKFFVQIGTLNERVEVHQRLNGVFKTTIHSADKFVHFLLTTVRQTIVFREHATDPQSESLCTTHEYDHWTEGQLCYLILECSRRWAKGRPRQFRYLKLQRYQIQLHCNLHGQLFLIRGYTYEIYNKNWKLHFIGPTQEH